MLTRAPETPTEATEPPLSRAAIKRQLAEVGAEYARLRRQQRELRAKPAGPTKRPIAASRRIELRLRRLCEEVLAQRPGTADEPTRDAWLWRLRQMSDAWQALGFSRVQLGRALVRQIDFLLEAKG
jgi:hypothetical protein